MTSVKGRRRLPRPVFALFSDYTPLCGAMTLLRGVNNCNELIASGQCDWLRDLDLDGRIDCDNV